MKRRGEEANSGEETEGRGESEREKAEKKETCQLKEKQQEEEYNESCPKCGLAYGTNDDILWICCDDCDRWFDYKCSGLWSRRRIPEKYTCVDCM